MMKDEKSSIEKNCESLIVYLENCLSLWKGTESELIEIANSCFSTLKTDWHNDLSDFTEQSDKNIVSNCYYVVEKYYKDKICTIFSEHTNWPDYTEQELYYRFN